MKLEGNEMLLGNAACEPKSGLKMAKATEFLKKFLDSTKKKVEMNLDIEIMHNKVNDNNRHIHHSPTDRNPSGPSGSFVVNPAADQQGEEMFPLGC